MNKRPLFKCVAAALACVAMALTSTSARAQSPGGPGLHHFLKAFAGTTFTLVPIEFGPGGTPTKFSHIVDGVVRVSALGNSTVHFDVIAVPTSPTTFSATGTGRITSADGTNRLDAVGEARVTLDPANPLFGNFHYDIRFIGGTGSMTNAVGWAEIDGVAMFTSPTEGKATWELQGHVVTPSALGIRPAGGGAVLSWEGSGFVLQSADQASGPWRDLSAGIAIGEGRRQTNVPTLGPTQFFRLGEPR